MSFQCTKCSFTSNAKTPGGLIKAIKRHRKQKPTHNKLTKIKELKK